MTNLKCMAHMGAIKVFSAVTKYIRLYYGYLGVGEGT